MKNIKKMLMALVLGFVLVGNVSAMQSNWGSQNQESELESLELQERVIRELMLALNKHFPEITDQHVANRLCEITSQFAPAYPSLAEPQIQRIIQGFEQYRKMLQARPSGVARVGLAVAGFGCILASPVIFYLLGSFFQAIYGKFICLEGSTPNVCRVSSGKALRDLTVFGVFLAVIGAGIYLLWKASPDFDSVKNFCKKHGVKILLGVSLMFNALQVIYRK